MENNLWMRFHETKSTLRIAVIDCLYLLHFNLFGLILFRPSFGLWCCLCGKVFEESGLKSQLHFPKRPAIEVGVGQGTVVLYGQLFTVVLYPPTHSLTDTRLFHHPSCYNTALTEDFSLHLGLCMAEVWDLNGFEDLIWFDEFCWFLQRYFLTCTKSQTVSWGSFPLDSCQAHFFDDSMGRVVLQYI